jgi:HTH-type transcriptional regulator / antitoxin HigA
MNIKPIRTEDDYEAACTRIDEIFHAEEGTNEDDEERFPIGMPDPIQAIEIQMQNLNLSRKDLMVALNKSSGRIFDILNRRRPLTLNDMRKLSSRLHIPIEVLAQEYPPKNRNPEK